MISRNCWVWSQQNKHWGQMLQYSVFFASMKGITDAEVIGISGGLFLCARSLTELKINKLR